MKGNNKSSAKNNQANGAVAAKADAPAKAPAAATSREPSRESEKKKQQLITMGKAKGYLTYEEVEKQMPEDIVTPDQLFAGPPFQYWLPQSPKAPGFTAVTYSMHDEIHRPYAARFAVNW